MTTNPQLAIKTLEKLKESLKALEEDLHEIGVQRFDERLRQEWFPLAVNELTCNLGGQCLAALRSIVRARASEIELEYKKHKIDFLVASIESWQKGIRENPASCSVTPKIPERRSVELVGSFLKVSRSGNQPDLNDLRFLHSRALTYIWRTFGNESEFFKKAKKLNPNEFDSRGAISTASWERAQSKAAIASINGWLSLLREFDRFLVAEIDADPDKLRSDEVQALERLTITLEPLFTGILEDKKLGDVEETLRSIWFENARMVLNQDLKGQFVAELEILVKRVVPGSASVYSSPAQKKVLESEHALYYATDKLERIAQAIEKWRVLVLKNSVAFESPHVFSALSRPPEPNIDDNWRTRKMERSQSESNDADVVVITALEKESEAMLRHFDQYETGKEIAGMSIYKSAVKTHSGKTNKTVVLQLRKMGNYEAAVATTRAIEVWNPAHILLVGIAGGVKAPDRLLGDVIIAERILAYEPGKVTDILTHRPQLLEAGHDLLVAAQSLPAKEWALSTTVPRPDGDIRTIPAAHFGLVASGEKVIANESFVKDLDLLAGKVTGIEMEGFGTALATFENGPSMLLIKAFCDWADPSKNDHWQEYAADVAASFAAALLRLLPLGVRDSKKKATKKGKPFSGRSKIGLCGRLGDNWEELADYFDIPLRDRERFRPGRQCEDIWKWLEQRMKLGSLDDALRFIGRDDLIETLIKSDDTEAL